MAAIWKLEDSADDLIEDDDLLDEEDLKKPDPSSLRGELFITNYLNAVET